MYRAAEALVERGLAYVDEQTPEQMRANRGDFNTPGTDSPFRGRTPGREPGAPARDARRPACRRQHGAAREDRHGQPNINLRDPALYRIKRAHHHNTGDRWCIYPMYTYAHPIEDALERITHSICTLEFEDQRPFYDWLLESLAAAGLLAAPLPTPAPKQYEFGRLNLTYVITSKRKLKALVDEGIVSGWDDPRMPTLAGMRRRGYTPASIRNGRRHRRQQDQHLGRLQRARHRAARRPGRPGPRAMAVLDPLPLKLTNWAEVFGSDGHREPCQAPAHPQRPELGQRQFELGPWCGSSATTSPRCRPRASSGCSRATRCA
jgi:glutaminyl-tRNA synthetase